MTGYTPAYLARRIEAAAYDQVPFASMDWEKYSSAFPDVAESFRQIAESILRAAFPDLFTDPPTLWMAPWEATHEMEHARGDPYEETVVNATECGLIWEAMRDAYLDESQKASP